MVKEQVERLGAEFLELIDTSAASEDAGGYAKEQSQDQAARQQQAMTEHLAQMDAVITTALIPGRPAPILLTTEMVQAMKPGSVIVDLAAERGGNCDCTEAGRDVVVHGVTLIGRTNLPAEVPAHASQMYSKNLLTFLDHLLDENRCLAFDLEDEITAGTLVSRGGEVVHPLLCELLAKREEERT